MDQPTQPDAYDSPWKEILESYFPEFMAFFFPEIYVEIDWSRGWESLDQELQQVVRDAESGRRLADKLFKVYRLDGQEQWVLIHVEIQGERDEGFTRPKIGCAGRPSWCAGSTSAATSGATCSS